MAAFSRGRTLFQLPHNLRSSTLYPPYHHGHIFSPLLRRAYASKPTNIPPKMKSASAVPFEASRLQSRLPKTSVSSLPVQAINAKTMNRLLTGPEPIYESPPMRSYVAAAYTLAAIFVGYGGYTVTLTSLGSPPEGLHPWVVMAMGVLSGGTMMVGLWCLLSTIFIVRRITAIPNSSGELILRFAVSKFLPWTRHTFQAPIANVTMNRSVEIRIAGLGIHGERKPLQVVSVFTRPWVWMGRAIFAWFSQTRSMFFREHMVSVNIKGGRNYQLDVRGQALGGAEGEFSFLKLMLFFAQYMLF